MSAAGLFSLILIRPCAVGLRRLAAGVTVQVDAASAAELIRGGQARLTDEADLPVLASMTIAQQVRPRLLAP